MKSDNQRDLEQRSLVGSRSVYEGRIVHLQLDTYELHGKTKVAEIIHHPGAVVIVPIDEKGKIHLVRQWRRAAKEILIELPAGTLEKNEKPEACAQRELQEEIGFAAGKMTPLDGLFTAPGFCDEYLYLFAAEDLYPSALPPDDDEQFDLLPTPLPDVIQMIKENKIRDAKTITGIFRFLLWKAQ